MWVLVAVLYIFFVDIPTAMALVLWECERNWRFLLRCVQLGRTSWKEERKRGREREREAVRHST